MVPTWGARACYWYLVGRGQGCCSTPHYAQDSPPPPQRIIQLRMTRVPKWRSPELVYSLLYLHLAPIHPLSSCPLKVSERLTLKVFNLDTFLSCIWRVWFPRPAIQPRRASITKHLSRQFSPFLTSTGLFRSLLPFPYKGLPFSPPGDKSS